MNDKGRAKSFYAIEYVIENVLLHCKKYIVIVYKSVVKKCQWNYY